MSSLREQILADQTAALKARDEKRLSILRMLSAALKNAEIEKQRVLNEDEVLAVAARQVKQLQDALTDFQKGGREDLVKKSNEEIAILQAYLPAQLTREEIKEAVRKILIGNSLTNSKETGKIMGLVMKGLKGKVDGNAVKEVVNEFLQKVL